MTTTEPDAVERMLPLYQGMMVGLYDHRAADVVRSASAQKRQNQPRYLTESDHRDPHRTAIPAYWVRQDLVEGRIGDWTICFADITSPTNERTLLPVALPKVACNNKLPLVISSEQESALKMCLLACLGSFVCDYQVRQKIGGTTLNYFYLKQVPVISPSHLKEEVAWRGKSWAAWISERVDALIATAYDFPSPLGGPPFVWDTERRVLLRAELDAAFFHLYGIERDDVDYIMETFPIVKRKDVAAYGEYRTKRLILEVFDAMQRAIDTGVAYETILDPPPGEGARHPARNAVGTAAVGSSAGSDAIDSEAIGTKGARDE